MTGLNDTAADKLIPLQGLRATAALSIAFAHLHHVFARTPGGISFGILAFAVDVFFVISGFIMMHREWNAFGKPGAPRSFLARRLARIVPIYWLVSLIYLYYVLTIPGLATANLTLDVVWKSFLFIPAIRPSGDVHPLLDIGWTLNYEMLFYISFGLILLLPRFLGVVAMLAGFLLLYNASRWIELSTAVAFWANIRLFEFMFGMGLAILVRLRPNLPGPACLGLIVAGIALWQLIVSGPPIPFLTGYVNVMVFFGSAALIVAGAVFYHGPLPGPVKWSFITLGDASYAIYLLHPLTYYYTPRFFGLNISEHSLSYMCFALTAVVLLAIAVHRYFENPVAQVLSRMLRKQPTPIFDSVEPASSRP